MGNLKAEYLEQTYIDLAPLKDAEDCRTYLTRSRLMAAWQYARKSAPFSTHCTSS